MQIWGDRLDFLIILRGEAEGIGLRAGVWGAVFQDENITPEGLAQHIFLKKLALSHMTFRRSPCFT